MANEEMERMERNMRLASEIAAQIRRLVMLSAVKQTAFLLVVEREIRGVFA